MEHLFRKLLIMLGVLLTVAGPALADKAVYLDLARRGWNYELRTTMVGRDLTIPIHINGRDLAGASLCILGERPHAQSLVIINAFRALVHHSFGKPVPMRYAGQDARACGSGRTILLRLFSGHPPNRALSADLRWMSSAYDLGLPSGRDYVASSPAQAQTFFGRRGQSTHIMVQQPALDRLGQMEIAYYRSILIEELFQSYTFGMDVLIFDRSKPLLSKLQETPLNLYRLPWTSRAFMTQLLRSNPGRLCVFDLFMLHAVGQSTVDQTVEPQFIDYIDSHYDDLIALAKTTMQDPRFAAIVDPACQRPS